MKAEIRLIIAYSGRCAWQVWLGEKCFGKYFTEAAATHAASLVRS